MVRDDVPAKTLGLACHIQLRKSFCSKFLVRRVFWQTLTVAPQEGGRCFAGVVVHDDNDYRAALHSSQVKYFEKLDWTSTRYSQPSKARGSYRGGSGTRLQSCPRLSNRQVQATPTQSHTNRLVCSRSRAAKGKNLTDLRCGVWCSRSLRLGV